MPGRGGVTFKCMFPHAMTSLPVKEAAFSGLLVTLVARRPPNYLLEIFLREGFRIKMTMKIVFRSEEVMKRKEKRMVRATGRIV